MGSRVLRFLRPFPVLVIVSCGYVTGTTVDAGLNVTFFGTAPSLLPAVVRLSVHTFHRSYLYIGGIAATPAQPQAFDPVGLPANDSLSAVLTVETVQGVELARAETGFRVQSRWDYGLGFQVGGQAASVPGACLLAPKKVVIPGFTGDTLFLWTSARPDGGDC